MEIDRQRARCLPSDGRGVQQGFSFQRQLLHCLALASRQRSSERFKGLFALREVQLIFRVAGRIGVFLKRAWFVNLPERAAVLVAYQVNSSSLSDRLQPRCERPVGIISVLRPMHRDQRFLHDIVDQILGDALAARRDSDVRDCCAKESVVSNSIARLRRAHPSDQAAFFFIELDDSTWRFVMCGRGKPATGACPF
jgi:hypothetical protein